MYVINIILHWVLTHFPPLFLGIPFCERFPNRLGIDLFFLTPERALERNETNIYQIPGMFLTL